MKIDLIGSFDEAGLHPAMYRNVKLAGYEAPTPIQKCTLPSIHLGYDTIGIAQTGLSPSLVMPQFLNDRVLTEHGTGSGKTAAYLIPILNKLMGKAKKLAAPRPNPAAHEELGRVRAEPLVVIVAPTRELATQIFNEARKFCYRTMLRPCVVYGGCPIREQAETLGKGCDVLVATPGRLHDFMGRPNALSMHRVRYMVIDEADEMLQADWGEVMNGILAGGSMFRSNPVCPPCWPGRELTVKTQTRTRETFGTCCSRLRSPSPSGTLPRNTWPATTSASALAEPEVHT